MVPLPTDRESVHLQVIQDGVEVFSQTVNCAANNYSYVVTLEGTGTAMVDVYIDGERSNVSGEVEFSNG